MEIWQQGTARSPEAAIAAPLILPIKPSSPLGTSVILRSAAGPAKMKHSVSFYLRSAHRERILHNPKTRAMQNASACVAALWFGV